MISEERLGHLLGGQDDPDPEAEPSDMEDAGGTGAGASGSGGGGGGGQPPIGFPAVDRNQLVQAWHKIETLSTEVDKALKDYKQVSPSRMKQYIEATPIDESMAWMRPERPAGATDIIRQFAPTDMGAFGMLFTDADFHQSVNQTVGKILETMKSLQKPTQRLQDLALLYGVNMTGKMTFKRMVMTAALVISKNARDIVERQQAAAATPV